MRRRPRAPRWARELAAAYLPAREQSGDRPITWIGVFDLEEPGDLDVIRRTFGRIHDRPSRADRNRIARALVLAEATAGPVSVFSYDLGVGAAMRRELAAAIARGDDGRAAAAATIAAGRAVRAHTRIRS